MSVTTISKVSCKVILIFRGNICDISILLYDKIDRLRRQIKTRKLLETERHHTMAKVSFHREDTNVCAPKIIGLHSVSKNLIEKRNRKFVFVFGGHYHSTSRKCKNC